MESGPYRYNDKAAPPSPPNMLFDGTRLGLEATMVTAFCIAIPAGLQSALSTTLGYLARYADGLPATARAFSIGGFIFAWLASILIICMAIFFSMAIPTMGYTMGLVAFSLFWLRKRWGRDQLANTVAGGILGFLFGIPCTILGSLLSNTALQPSLYAELLRWPALLSIDGILTIWLTLYPFISIIGGIRSGRKIGEIVENMKLYMLF